MPKLLISQKKIIEHYVNEQLEKGTRFIDAQNVYDVVAKRKEHELLWNQIDRYSEDYQQKLLRPDVYTGSIEQFRKGWG